MGKIRFHQISLNRFLGAMFIILVLESLISFVIYGSYFSPDTVNYFSFSKTLFSTGSWSEFYSPFYPLILRVFSSLPFFTLLETASFLVVLLYFLGGYFLYQLTITISDNHLIHPDSRTTYILLVFIAHHSWWSFRIISWAHADAVFYAFLIVWAYFLTKYHLNNSLKNLLILSVLSAGLIWVKLNAVTLVPFFWALLLIEQKKQTWLVPLCMTSVSYGVYRYFFPKNLLDSPVQDSHFTILFSIKNMEILESNLAELLRVTLGFFLSDVVTAYIPHIIALVGGISLLLFLLFQVFRDIKGNFTLSSFFILFGFIYILSLLAFQQMAGHEEINYRTLFPFFIGCSWYLWGKLAFRRKPGWFLILILGILMTGYTSLGHVWIWNRQDNNSLFEVSRLRSSEMAEKIQWLRCQTFFQDALLVTDYPEKLTLVTGDPHAVHYDPDSQFINGKRRPINLQARKKNQEFVKEKLVRGEGILVLFSEDRPLIDFSRAQGLAVLDFPEGWIIYKDPPGPRNP